MKSRKITYFKCFSPLFVLIAFILITGCNGVPPTAPIINSFSVDSPSITEGEFSTLSWSVTGATMVTIDQGIGTVTLSGTTTVNPLSTTTYTLTATNAAGSVTASVTVTVVAAYGSIDINSTPSGAKVYLNDVDTGSVTPIVLTNVEPGIHTVKLDKYHYKIKENNISVTAGETTYLNWSLTYAPTESIALQPGSEGKDADVYKGAPEGNWGWWGSLMVGFAFNDRYRAYLQFELSPTPLPAGAVVINARLRLYQHDFGGLGTFSVGLYQVTSDWGEDSITWNNQPTSSSDAEDFCTIATSTGTWRTWYIDDLVKGWLEGSISNYGMLLKPSDEESNDKAAQFYSSDYADSTKRPQLVIAYYMP